MRKKGFAQCSCLQGLREAFWVLGGSENYGLYGGYHFGGPYNKDYSNLGLYWGSLILGNYHIVDGSYRVIEGRIGYV